MITAAKSCQNIIDILGAQKPTWTKFSEFAFFYLKRQSYIDITKTKINMGTQHPVPDPEDF